jgi:hypothetical protein
VVLEQAAVTEISGEVVIGQVVVTLVVATSPQLPVDRAVKVLVTEQATGAVKLPVNVATAPGARDTRVKTVVFAAGLSLVTTMFDTVTLPALLTLPE